MKSSDEWSVLHSNFRSYDNKAFFMNNKIIPDLKPSVLNYNELWFRGRRKLQIPGYRCYNVNHDNNKGGGVATSFVNADAAHVLKIHEGTRNELLVTRINKFAFPINIVNLYGKQECRTSKNEIEDDWQEVLEVLGKIDALDEEVLFLGDMNRLVGNIVKGNHDKVSFSGTLIRELLSSGNYKLLNASDKVENGPFTRYEPNE